MNIRQQFEREFSGCLSRNKILDAQEEVHQLRLELKDLKRKHSQLCSKGIYLIPKSSDGYRRCGIKEETKGKIVLLPLSEGQASFVLSRRTIDCHGFVWIYELGDRFWTGRCLRERLREKMKQCRVQLDRTKRVADQMEGNWKLFNMALTEWDLEYAVYCGFDPASLIKDPVIASRKSLEWKRNGWSARPELYRRKIR